MGNESRDNYHGKNNHEEYDCVKDPNRKYYKKRQQVRRRRRIRRFLRRIILFLFLICICLGLIKAAGTISDLYDCKGFDKIDSLLNSQERDYEKLASLLEKETESDIVRKLQELAEKNEEALDFVENYVNRERYLGQEIDLTNELNSSEIPPLLMQWDKRWGYEEYGDSIMGLSGCGPTCLSMAYLYFTGDATGNPREMGIFCEEYGYYTQVGTSWELWTDGVAQLGLSGKVLSLDESVMKNALNDGKIIICSMRPGDFTTTGHYILIYDYNEQGFLIHDPNRKSNSEKIWSYDTLNGQIKNLWAITD